MSAKCNGPFVSERLIPIKWFYPTDSLRQKESVLMPTPVLGH